MIEVGKTYRFRGDDIVFVVLAEIDDYRMSSRDTKNRRGFKLLILDGEFTPATMTGEETVVLRPGSTLDVARGSWIAAEAKPFV